MRKLVAVLVFATACSGSDTTFVMLPEIPADIAFIAATLEDSNGRLIAASPLSPRGSNAVFRFVEVADVSNGAIDIVGYTRADLEMMGAPSETALAASALDEATGCAPRLAAPSFSARLSPSGASLTARTPPRELTVAWLDGVCPQLAADVSIDVACRYFPCASFARQDGCALTFDLDNCTLGIYEAHVDWAGHVCVERSSLAACSAVDPRAPAIASVDCGLPDPCMIDMHLPPARPHFVLDEVQILPVAPRAQSGSPTLGTRTWMRLTGFLGDVLVLEDRVAVVSHTGEYREGAHCEGGREELVFIDREAMTEIETATAPPCISNLVRAAGGGFYGTIGPRSDVRFGVFDRSGRLLAEHELALPSRNERNYDPIDAILASTGEVVIGFRWSDRLRPEESDGALIAAVELTAFQTRIFRDDPGGSLWSLAESDDGILAVTDEEDDDVKYFDSRTGAFLNEILPLAHVSSVTASGMAYFAATREFAVAVPSEEPAVHIVDIDGERGKAVYFEQDAGPLDVMFWPSDPERLLVTSAYAGLEPVRDVWLSLFEPRVPRFLPGAQRLGFGVSGRSAIDGDRVWITLPWEAKLVRVSPGS